jgi:hypothetical protein
MKDQFSFTNYVLNNPLLEEADMEEGLKKSLEKKMLDILEQNRAIKHLQIIHAAGPAIEIVRSILNQQSGADEQAVEDFIQKHLTTNTYEE